MMGSWIGKVYREIDQKVMGLVWMGLFGWLEKMGRMAYFRAV